jgi:hypothetical protein
MSLKLLTPILSLLIGLGLKFEGTAWQDNVKGSIANFLKLAVEAIKVDNSLRHIAILALEVLELTGLQDHVALLPRFEPCWRLL